MSESNFYTDGQNEFWRKPDHWPADNEPKILNPQLDPEEVLHPVGSIALMMHGEYDSYGPNQTLLVLLDITRAMIRSVSPPPVDNPRYLYLWVNDELANVADKAIEMGWCKVIPFVTSDKDHGEAWQFAVNAALFK